MPNPKRAGNVHVESIGEELCVYVTDRKEVHALNPTAAAVWELCDGRTPVSEIISHVRAQFDTEQAGELVEMTLERLREAHLLTADAGGSSKVTRREALSRLGVAAAMLPVVATIVAPTAAMAQSGACLSQEDFGDACPRPDGIGPFAAENCDDCMALCAERCPDGTEFNGLAMFIPDGGSCACCCDSLPEQ